MGELLLGGAIVVICSNVTCAKIVASTGVILNMCGVKQGKTVAVTSGVIYTVINIVKWVI